MSELKSTKNQRKSLKISGWQEYKLTDLFTGHNCLIARGQRIKQRDRISGTIPLVTAGMENQGVADTIADNGVNILYPADSITIDMFGNTFCHNGPFYADDNILILHNSKYHYDELLFIAAVVNKTARQMSSYKSQFRMNSLNKLTIKLPALSDGTPDWATMRKRVADLVALSHRDVTSLDSTELPIFVGDWQEFKIEDLFEKCNLHKVKAFDRRYDLSDRKTDEFSLPVVNAKHGNNGIMFYGRKKDFDFVDHSLCVVQNGAIATGDVYPEVQSTGVYQDAYLIKYVRTDLSIGQLSFLASIIQRITKTRFSYDDKCTWPKLKKLLIKLPVDFTGKPDFHYIDNYVKLMQSISFQQLQAFKQVIN